MVKYIDADALKDKIAKLFPEDKCGCNTEEEMVAGDCLFAVMKLIDEQPAADVAPVVQGRWREDTDPVDGDIRCTNCGIAWPKCFRDEIAEQGIWTLQTLFRYCPNCGAKMDGMDGEKK